MDAPERRPGRSAGLRPGDSVARNPAPSPTPRAPLELRPGWALLGTAVTLRLRLTLMITLVAAMVLIGGGAGLRLLLRSSLQQGLDESLQQAMNLLARFLEVEEGVPHLHPEGEPLPQLRADLGALLVDVDGRVLERLGRAPDELPPLEAGFATRHGLRVLVRPSADATLVVVRDAEVVLDSLQRFDRSFLLLTPFVALATFGLAYVFAGRGLRHLEHLTLTAYDLATRRAWRERLPQPRWHDEVWHMAAATNALLDSLESVIESERRFTAAAAHELRTPLTVLRGRLEQALEHSRGEPQQRVAKALDASEGLLELVEKLLALSRADAGRAPPLDTVELDAVAFHTADALRPAFEAKGLQLQLQLPPMPTLVRGDATALTLALRNLLENALKFTDAGEVRLRVDATPGGGRVVVEDSGPGIPDAALPHLFERFYQVEVRHRRYGSGLGLALVRSIATWHGGRAGVENTTGGARFWLELPAG